MTTELQQAMVRYEEARIRYKTAVLASLDGASNGEAIREAIRSFQRASAELKRLRPRPALAPQPANSSSETTSFPGWTFVRRLLTAS